MHAKTSDECTGMAHMILLHATYIYTQSRAVAICTLVVTPLADLASIDVLACWQYSGPLDMQLLTCAEGFALAIVLYNCYTVTCAECSMNIQQLTCTSIRAIFFLASHGRNIIIANI